MGIILTGEEKCKAAFEPWFTAGGWTVQDFTGPRTAELNIPQSVKAIKYPDDRDYVRSILYNHVNACNFQHDAEIVRGNLQICVDYKFIKFSYRGQLFAHKGDNPKNKEYDYYYSLKKPWFYLLLYAGNNGRMYTHQVRDPVAAGYKIRDLPHYNATGCVDGTVPYYDITQDCIEAKIPNFPVTFPMLTEDMNDSQSYALTIAFKRWSDSGYSEPFKGWTEDDLKAGVALSNLPKNKRRMGIALRKWRNRFAES